MNAEQVDKFLVANENKFPSYEIPIHRLLELDNRKIRQLEECNFQNPKIIFLVSLLFGTFGVDRFIIGDIGSGIGKLLTLGGFGIWNVLDWFLIITVTKRRNMDKLLNILSGN